MVVAVRAAVLLLAVGTLFSLERALAGGTIELAETGFFVEPFDFAVDGTHAYILYARSTAGPPGVRLGAGDFLLGIYERASGREVMAVGLAQLVDTSQDYTRVMRVKVGAYRDGAVVAAVNATDHATFVYVNRHGEVGKRRLVEDFNVIALARHRNLVMAASNEGRLALFDEGLVMTHEWSAPDRLLLVDSNDSAITVVDGVLNPAGEVGYTSTVRQLVVTDRIEERDAVPVPIDIAVFPPPKLVSWPDRLILVTWKKPGTGWLLCGLDLTRRDFQCGDAAWTGDLRELPPELRGWLLEVAQSGDGYVVAQFNACGIWSRRYDRYDSITHRQLAVPSGSSELGHVDKLLVRAWNDDSVFLLTSAFVTEKGWDPESSWEKGGRYRTVLREGTLFASSPVRSTTKFDSCPSWSDGHFARRLTADEVRSCVAKGADPNAEFNCGAWTRPLGMAAREGNGGVVRALIAAGAEVNAQDEVGDTALHDAARHAESAGAIQALLEGGADERIRNVVGKVPWDYVQDNDALGDAELVRKLLAPEDER